MKRRERRAPVGYVHYRWQGRQLSFVVYEDCDPDCGVQHGTPIHVGLCAHIPRLIVGRARRHPLQFRYYKRKRAGVWL